MLTKNINHTSHHKFFLNSVSSFDVINITNKLKTKTSFDHDGISTKLLKATINRINGHLHIINTSFETGIVPRDMKIAKVMPILKCSDPTLINKLTSRLLKNN